MILANLRAAFLSLRANRLRTALSALGIVIGVASVVTISTLGNSTTAGIQADIASAGLETITVLAGRDAGREVRRLFTEELAEDLESIEGVLAATPMNGTNLTYRLGTEYATETTFAVEPVFQEVFNLSLARGRFIGTDDIAARRLVVVLGADLAESLFGEAEPVGEHIRFIGDQSRQLRVIGVLEAKPDTLGFSFDTSAYVPRSTYLARVENAEYVNSYVLRANLDHDVLETADAVEAYLDDVIGEPEAVRVVSPSTIADTFSTVTSTLQAFLTGIAAISLIVGGIGIMNIMLVSVTERTREIGIRKALGATSRRILGQFLTEAIMVTGVGGLAGVGLGIGLSMLVTTIMGLEFTASVTSYVVALVFSAGVGLFFGLYPAARAARLDPAVALSYE
jgi:putative ABC transport system permease protein